MQTCWFGIDAYAEDRSVDRLGIDAYASRKCASSLGMRDFFRAGGRSCQRGDDDARACTHELSDPRDERDR